jgi:cytochrome b561
VTNSSTASPEVYDKTTIRLHWATAILVAIQFAHAFPLFNLWHFPKLGDDEFMRRVNAWHGFVANILVMVVLFHSAAALIHHCVTGDGVLRRMWPRLRNSRFAARSGGGKFVGH